MLLKLDAILLCLFLSSITSNILTSSYLAMELNDHHYQNVLNFLKFSRFRRGQKLRVVDANFEDILASRVSIDETYTGDEVVEILQVGLSWLKFSVRFGNIN